jgi:hypothetical protein
MHPRLHLHHTCTCLPSRPHARIHIRIYVGTHLHKRSDTARRDPEALLVHLHHFFLVFLLYIHSISVTMVLPSLRVLVFVAVLPSRLEVPFQGLPLDGYGYGHRCGWCCM